MFKVAVIIPVYNAKAFLRKAVESALQFHCVKEVLLIEDASPDNALELCYILAKEDDRVKVFTHPNNENRGAGASRNLGIEKSNCEYIAFLDADDWYLPNRFDAERIIFQDENIDGVYGATGFYYQETDTIAPNKLTTVLLKVKQEDLLYEIVRPYGGRFHTNAITIRKTGLTKTGLFDTNLRLHQDSDLWCKLAFHCRLERGIFDKPLSCVRIHENNRIINRNKESLKLYYKKQFDYYLSHKGVQNRVFRIIFKSYIISKTKSNNNIYRILNLFFEILKNPKVILKCI